MARTGDRQPQRPSLPGTGGDVLSERCEGLMFALEPSPTRSATTRRARRAADSALPGRWQVSALAAIPGLYQALRVQPGSQPLVRNAWELARRLDADDDVQWAEAAVIQPGHDPSPAMAGVRSPLSGIGRKPRACAESPDWSLVNTRLLEAFRSPPGGAGSRGGGIRIAHPDTGYTRHPEIWDPDRLAVKLGYDFEGDRADPKDPLEGRAPGHGTATASVIMSAVGAQAAPPGVTGAAPLSTLIPLRVADGVVHFSFRRLVLALERAIALDCDIASMSLGGPFASRALSLAVGRAGDAGMILLAAAGNIWPAVVYPARFDEVIAVAASRCDDGVWAASASGRGVDLSAPGESVWRALAERPERYRVAPGSGTSYAVATVAGAAAVWLSHHGRGWLRRRYPGDRLPALFREMLLRHGVRRPRGWDTTRHGAGILDAMGLVSASLPARRPATARRSSAPTPEFNSPAEIARYFPGLDEVAVGRLLRRFLRTDEAGLAPILERFGDELRYHMAVSPALRATLASRRPSVAGRRVGEHLARFGSRELRARLGA